MKHVARTFYWVSALGLGFASVPVVNADEAAAKFSRQVLLSKQAALTSKDVETKVIRVQFPKGYKTPLHTHEGPGPRYVLKGKLKVEDSGQTTVFGPGEVFWETGAEMTVENVGKGDAEIIIFEIVPTKSDAR
ncbi:cupin domain-containing protein [Methylomonas sp. MgM2]